MSLNVNCRYDTLLLSEMGLTKNIFLLRFYDNILVLNLPKITNDLEYCLVFGTGAIAATHWSRRISPSRLG